MSDPLREALEKIAGWEKYTKPTLENGEPDASGVGYESGANDAIDTLAQIARAALSSQSSGEWRGDQQLVARIKRSSKYYGQTEPGAWFDVRVVADASYHLRGNNNNYRLSDVAFGMRIDGGTVVDLANGKTD